MVANAIREIVPLINHYTDEEHLRITEGTYVRKSAEMKVAMRFFVESLLSHDSEMKADRLINRIMASNYKMGPNPKPILFKANI